MLESDLLPTPTSLEAGFPLMYLAALHLDQAGRALPLCSLPPAVLGVSVLLTEDSQLGEIESLPADTQVMCKQPKCI